MSSWNFTEGDEIVAGRRAVRLLGGGHRYEAYLAWDEHLRALVVVKVVRPDRVEDPETLRGLAGESAALERLAHPLLVRAFAAEPHGPRPHVVLEHVEGPRLSTLIRSYGVALEQALPLAVNLCSVLHYVAREGWVHLDVKPRNIIMAGGPRLIDLSIARSFEGLAAIRRPTGTDAYMAPEQADPARFELIGPAADVWGLGVTLHEALAGENPFPQGDVRFPQLHMRPRELPDHVPAPLADAIEACLAFEPADRPAAGELADALEPMAGALPAPRLGRFRPGAKRLMRRLEAA